MNPLMESVLLAKRMIVGQDLLFAEYARLKKLIKDLKNFKEFWLARRLLRLDLQQFGQSRSPAEQLWIRQQLALCTYKDEELQTENALDEALEILSSGFTPETEKYQDSETLALIGAIHKRRAEISGQRGDMERSIYYYQLAIDAGKRVEKSAPDKKDEGLASWTYAAINAAFVCDQLAVHILTQGDRQADDAVKILENVRALAMDLIQQAKHLREEVKRAQDALTQLANREDDPEKRKGKWWVHATLVEALYGLHDFAAASTALQEGLKVNPPDWELESSTRQWTGIYRLHTRLARDHPSWKADEAMRVLRLLVPEAVAKALGVGKMGLALSGGGFRAALYHAGVLAFLAERDLLRWVEVISCVSGGSITGALYYLELREVLNTQESLTRKDYICIVVRVINRLIHVMDDNLRNRVVWKSLRDWSKKRTTHLGRELERALFAEVGNHAPDQPLPLKSIKITPQGVPDFHPRRDNWKRQDKVPVLIINATTLNTGHNWQFTASWMGEAPAAVEEAVDVSERLRRFYFHEIPGSPHECFSLGSAVAASLSLPPFLNPVILENLYPGRTVKLIDGGVDDNQGIFGLLEQDCNLLVVSDGSGQFWTERKPGGFLSNLLQINRIFMQSVRRALYRVIDARQRSGRIRDLLYVHMRQNDYEPDVTWQTGKEDAFAHRTASPKALPGISPDVQRAVSEIRTDLDRFSPEEWHSLMYAGYVLASRQFQSGVHGRVLAELASRDDAFHWPFLSFKEMATARDHQNQHYRTVLREGKKLKLFRWCSFGLRYWISLRAGKIFKLFR
ncbi:MAG: patatin-like phospholipase family protein [Magnetococcales bacterium]|nr:patatin-like phospholipase family protein [Magnetococcales bacterium]